MSILIKNACLIELDPPAVGRGDVRVESATIVAVAGSIEPGKGEDVIDANGAVVMCGLVNGHTHLYTALGLGMPDAAAPPADDAALRQARSRLARLHDAASLTISATIGALDALRAGVTTLIDHHSSPGAIDESLDCLLRGVEGVGPRVILSYATTDRDGPESRDAGIQENLRFANAVAARHDGRVAAMLGADLSFTLADDALAALADSSDLPLHLDLSEDASDERISRERYGASPIERLDRHGLLRPTSILAHAVHLGPADLAPVQQAMATIAHLPRSNMFARVGRAPIDRLGVPVMLGTGVMGADVLAEAQTAWLHAREDGLSIRPQGIVAMLGAAQRAAGPLLGMRLGELRPGAAADLVVTDYVPSTPIHEGNLAQHVLERLGAGHVRHVMVAGRWALFDRNATGVHEHACRSEAVAMAKSLWARMSEGG